MVTDGITTLLIVQRRNQWSRVTSPLSLLSQPISMKTLNPRLKTGSSREITSTSRGFQTTTPDRTITTIPLMNNPVMITIDQQNMVCLETTNSNNNLLKLYNQKGEGILLKHRRCGVKWVLANITKVGPKLSKLQETQVMK
jgi:hypothetical protein